MKKKGLLISTIVMVVVLVASLTTATYAWFSAEAQVTIENMSLTTQATKGLKIGALHEVSGSDWLSYVKGQVSMNDSNSILWEGEDGMSDTITFQNSDTGTYEIAIENAVSQTVGDFSGFSASGAFIKAAADNTDSTGQTVATDSIDVAKANKDYMDLCIGVAAQNAGVVKQAYCTVTIDPNSAEKLGMAACLHGIIYVNGVKAPGFADGGTDIFSSNALTVPTAASPASGLGTIDGDGNLVYTFMIFDGISSSTTLSDTEPYKVEFLFWYEGTDVDCNNAQTGTGVTVRLNFSFTNTETGSNTASITNGILTLA